MYSSTLPAQTGQNNALDGRSRRNQSRQRAPAISTGDGASFLEARPPITATKRALFHDFDRIFALITAATGSTQTAYDMFGHSAGAQILHRLVLFAPGSRAERIVAANSGFYTLANLDQPLPVGLKGTGVTQDALARSFACKLMVLVGEKDDGDEAGGIQIHTPLIDQQGIGRLARGQYFFRTARERARTLQVPFRWSLQVVPDVGHDFRAMSRAAARELFG